MKQIDETVENTIQRTQSELEDKEWKDTGKKKNNYPKNRKSKAFKYSEEYCQEAIRLYESGMSMTAVAKKLGKTLKVIWRIFERKNVIRRFPCQYMIKYEYDRNFFSKIDTEVKAYWLGFLYADGSVSKKTGMRVELAIKDEKHLLKFKKDINTNQPLYIFTTKTREKHPSVCLQIAKQQIFNDLVALGCVPNKSLILKFPTVEQVPKHLISHFMRGYFDGDGCITINNKRKSTTYKFSVVSTKSFLKEYQKIILENIKISSCNIHKYKDANIYDFTISGRKNLVKLKRFLYQNATIYLTRKKKIFNRIRLRASDII